MWGRGGGVASTRARFAVSIGKGPRAGGGPAVLDESLKFGDGAGDRRRLMELAAAPNLLAA